jgi:hypothetical protein
MTATPTLAHMRYLQDMSKRAAAEPDAPLTFDMLLGIVLGMSRAKADPGAPRPPPPRSPRCPCFSPSPTSPPT